MSKKKELEKLLKLKMDLFKQLEKVKLDIRHLYLDMPRKWCNTCQKEHYGPWMVGSCKWPGEDYEY